MLIVACNNKYISKKSQKETDGPHITIVHIVRYHLQRMGVSARQQPSTSLTLRRLTLKVKLIKFSAILANISKLVKYTPCGQYICLSSAMASTIYLYIKAKRRSYKVNLSLGAHEALHFDRGSNLRCIDERRATVEVIPTQAVNRVLIGSRVRLWRIKSPERMCTVMTICVNFMNPWNRSR